MEDLNASSSSLKLVDFQPGRVFNGVDGACVLLCRQMARGTFGVVLDALRDGKFIAVKVMQTISERELYMAEQEDGLFKKVQMCKYVPLYFGITKFPDCHVLEMELCGRTLKELLEDRPPSRPWLDFADVKNYATQLMEGLFFLHSQQVVHCDLKPSNICLGNHNKNIIKIIDFGCSYSTERLESAGKSVRGTMGYYAPEVMLGMKKNSKIDIWSAGATLAEIYLGVKTFAVCTNGEFLRLLRFRNLLPRDAQYGLNYPHIARVEYYLPPLFKRPYDRWIGDAAEYDPFSAAIFALLTPDAENRPSAEEVVEAGLFSSIEKGFLPTEDSPTPPTLTAL